MIDTQSSSDFVNEDGNDNSTPGICGLNKNNDNLLLIELEAEDVCVGSHREIRRIDTGDIKDNNVDDTKIFCGSKEHLKRCVCVTRALGREVRLTY